MTRALGMHECHDVITPSVPRLTPPDSTVGPTWRTTPRATWSTIVASAPPTWRPAVTPPSRRPADGAPWPVTATRDQPALSPTLTTEIASCALHSARDSLLPRARVCALF